METDVIILIAAGVLATSFLSGIFGMAGGMILMALLLFLLPVPQAMILHGVVQAASNGWRAALHYRAIVWPVIWRYCIGAAGALALFSFLRVVPDKALVYLLLGGVTLCALLLPPSLALDATKRGMSELCGFFVNALHLTAGVSGVFLHIFFIKSPLNRHQSIATRGQTQLIGHLIKIVYFGLIATTAIETAAADEIAYEVYGIMVLLAFGGALGGKYVLDRMAEASFQRISHMIILVLAGFCLVRGGMLITG